MSFVFLIIVVVNCCFLTILCDLFECHDDPGYDPPDGHTEEFQFSWLGTLQYIHIKRGTPHYFRVPRVVLVSRQYVLSTAMDAGTLPPDYALGNVVFSDYERDDTECELSKEEREAGIQCDPAVMIIPIVDVYLHPEFKTFGIKNSIALLKLLVPVKSTYMLPVCLPDKNFLFDEKGVKMRGLLRHVDYPTDSPRDFTEEDKYIVTIKLLPRETCFVYNTRRTFRRSDESKYVNMSHTHGRTLCTTGCGFHSGAPTIIHEHTGHWTVIALAKGGPPCPDPLRRTFLPATPYHIPLYPYVAWITSVIDKNVPLPSFENRDPFGFITRQGGLRQALHQGKNEKEVAQKGWVGHWWLSGLRCFDRGEAAVDLHRFYSDILEVEPDQNLLPSLMTHYLQIDAPPDTMIDCIKVGMPEHSRTAPLVWDLLTVKAKIRLPLLKFRTKYRVVIEAWGHFIRKKN